MGNIEHWIGVRMAAGYDEQDFIELCDSVAGRPSVERVEIGSSLDQPGGAIAALEAARDYIEAGSHPTVEADTLARVKAALTAAGGQ
jgi:hypothetical protein